MIQLHSTISAFFASLLIRVFRWSWRVRVIHTAPLPQDGRVVFCFWHGEQASLFAYSHRMPVAILVSLSKDGALQAKILARLGFVVCRGSSSRGGAKGLKGMIARVREGMDAAFAVDGPRGPYHEAKPGAIETAKHAGAVIVPIRGFANRVWVFRKSWDLYILPKPFARVVIHVGAPLKPDELTSEQLTESLNGLDCKRGG